MNILSFFKISLHLTVVSNYTASLLSPELVLVDFLVHLIYLVLIYYCRNYHYCSQTQNDIFINQEKYSSAVLIVHCFHSSNDC